MRTKTEADSGKNGALKARRGEVFKKMEQSQHGGWEESQWQGPQSALKVKVRKVRKPGKERGHN